MTVDEKGDITVNGVKVGGTETSVMVNGIVEGVQVGDYRITSEDGTFYVTIDGKKYEVVPTVNGANGDYMVSWSFADDSAEIEIANGTQEKALPEGVEIDEKGSVTLKDSVTIDGNQFVVKNGQAYILVDGLEYEVALTASGDAANGYTLKWNCKVENLPAGSVEDITFDQNGISNAVNGIWQEAGVRITGLGLS